VGVYFLLEFYYLLLGATTSLFLSISSLARISFSSSTCASSLDYTSSLACIFSLCLNSYISACELWRRVSKAALSSGFTPSFTISSLELSFYICRGLELALSCFILLQSSPTTSRLCLWSWHSYSAHCIAFLPPAYGS